MTDERSQDEVREEFAQYVRSTVSPQAPARPEFDPGSTEAVTLGLFERLFDFRVALAALGLLFLIFASASHIDARRYRAIFDEHRYSMGESDQFRWRYDGLDNNMRASDRRLSFWDRERLRHSGLHVTYSEYSAHRLFRGVRMASGLLLVLGLLIAGRSAWMRFRDGGDEGYVPDAEETVAPTLPPQARTGRPVFGRRTD